MLSDNKFTNFRSVSKKTYAFCTKNRKVDEVTYFPTVIYKTPGQDFSRRAVRRLALDGQRGIRSVFSICKQVANTPLLFYSISGAG